MRVLKIKLIFLRIIAIFILITATTWPVSGTVITTSISSRKLSVGDLLHFTVNIITAKGATVYPPTPETDFGSVTVREWNLHKTEREKSDSLSYEYIITTYKPEPCTIPELSFRIESGGSADTLKTEAIALQVVSVLPADTVDIMGLKGPFRAGRPPRWWLWLTGIAAAILLISFGSIWLSRRLRKVPPPPPPVPPYEEAIEALRGLGAKKYIERGLYREYVFELSEIFKRYIGRRFSCNATDFTTEEMIAWTGAADLPKKQSSRIEWFFRTTDPVKFARQIPETQLLERLLNEVKEFLEETRPVAENQAGSTATTSPQAGTETTSSSTSSVQGGGK